MAPAPSSGADGLARVAAAAAPHGLALLGALHPGAGDGAPPGTGTLVLLGPEGPAFWAAFAASPEHADQAPDPLDRWSRRVIGGLAAGLGAAALFPFGGPPWQPFTAWARASGHAFASPVGLLVHDRAGLFVSYRGALALAARLDLPAPGVRPCDSCAAPCLAGCPAAALGGDGYDVPACHAWLDGPDGGDCLAEGCRVRRACPVGAGGQPAAQRRFHMAAHHPRRASPPPGPPSGPPSGPPFSPPGIRVRKAE